MLDAYRPPSAFRLPWSVTIAKLPLASKYLGQMIWVTDLHQDFAGVAMPGWVLSDGGLWRPLRSAAVGKLTAAAGSTTWTPLKHRPTVIVTGALAVGTMTIALSNVGAWNGCEAMLVRQATGAGVLSLLGKTVALGGALRTVFDGSAWQPLPTTGLL